MKKMFHHETMKASAASSKNACFAVSFCLMMGAICVVSIILFMLVFLLGVGVLLLSDSHPGRKLTMAPEYV